MLLMRMLWLSPPYTPFHEPCVVESFLTNAAVPVGGTPGLPAPPNRIALITAFAFALVLVTRAITCPLRFHTRYCPLLKPDTVRESSTVPFPSTMSTRSLLPPPITSQSSRYSATWCRSHPRCRPARFSRRPSHPNPADTAR